MDIVTLGAALNGSAEYVNSHFKGGSNIQIVDNPDGTQTINASGEVSSEDTVARAEIAEMKDGTNIDSFGDVETALDTKANTSTTYTKTEVDTALSAKQNTISDLATIRSGAALGATAVQPETGKGLSTNDYTDAEKTKLAGIEAQANKTTIDDALSGSSTNPVQNKVIKSALDSKADTSDIPTVPITAIQKNGTGIAPVSGTVNITVPTQASDINAATATQGGKADTAIQGIKVNSSTVNPDSNKVVSITVPTSARDVSALPDTTKYAAALNLTINSSTYVMTGQLKDQNGDNLGAAQTINLPLESVVVDGSYDSQTNKVVLTLQNGNTIEFSVADLVSGLQTELSASNKLNPAYIDYDSTHAAVTEAQREQIETNKNNILLIEQYDNELSHTGKNLYNYKDVTEGYYINSSGKLVANNALYTSSLIPVKANQSYTISSTSSNTFLYVAVYATTLVYTQLNATQTYNGFTFTPTEDCYMRFSGVINAKTTVQVEIGNSKTAFEKYTRYINSDIDISEAQNTSPISEYSYIKNGELVCNNDHINNSLVVAKYNQVDMGNDITKIMAKIKINDPSITGVAKAALIIGNNDTGHGISDITNKSIHVVFTRDKVQVGVFNNGTLSSENITYSAWTDGSTYEIGYELKGDDTLRVYLPDGTSSDIILQGVDINQGQYAIYQQYNENVVATTTPTTNTPQIIFKGFYCECQGGLPLKDNFHRPNGGLTVSPTGHTYKQFRNVSTTDTNYDNTN